MASSHYAISELNEETWEHRIARVNQETRDLIAATRKVITASRGSLVAADESLKRRQYEGGEAMPIRTFLHDKAFDPEAIETLNAAFLGACADLGLSDKDDAACEIVAKRVIELANGQRDPEAIRKAVLASISSPFSTAPN